MKDVTETPCAWAPAAAAAAPAAVFDRISRTEQAMKIPTMARQLLSLVNKTARDIHLKRKFSEQLSM
jgi:hypothetical protein